MKINKIAIVPVMAELYEKLFNAEAISDLNKSIECNVNALKSDFYKFEISKVVTSAKQIAESVKYFEENSFELIVVFFGPYCASGVVYEGVKNCTLPLLLWPAQNIYEINYTTCIDRNINISHGVHAVQDLANILRKRGKKFGIIHGDVSQDQMKEKFVQWVKAASLMKAFVHSKPIQLGGSFQDMLDLQIEGDEFLRQMAVKPESINSEKLLNMAAKVTDEDTDDCIKIYRQLFDISDDVHLNLLEKSARYQIAIKSLMAQYDSHACGVNFLELCNDQRIADAMHVAASMLMADGEGYAAEGDWLTAAMVYACQCAFGIASFSEMFSVDYKNDRVLLKHWGEGNPLMAAKKPKIKNSMFRDHATSYFAVIDMEFAQGDATLVNLNSDIKGNGQLITVSGYICDEPLGSYNGVRSLFRPHGREISEVLDTYAYNGGSHHLVLVMGDAVSVISKLSKLTGWEYIKI